MKKFIRTLCIALLLVLSFSCFNAVSVGAEQGLEWTGYYEQQYDLTKNTATSRYPCIKKKK